MPINLTIENNPLEILLIEDSKGDAVLIQKSLEEALRGSHTLELVNSLEAATKKLLDHKYDIALLDRSLPDVESFDGLHRLQAMAPALPIVFLTAYQDEEIALEAIQQGAQDYLYKDRLDGHTIKRAVQYAILRKQFEGVLITRANFDMLTGLANRMFFENRLALALSKAERHGGKLATLFMDLDRFKQVNDTLGHAAGDELLKQVAERLKQALRPYDTVSRFGGDEFAILLEEITELNQSEVVATKVISLLEKPFNLEGQKINIGVSIGIASCHGGNIKSIEFLMKQADQAMYEAKSKSGSSFKHYDAAA